MFKQIKRLVSIKTGNIYNGMGTIDLLCKNRAFHAKLNLNYRLYHSNDEDNFTNIQQINFVMYKIYTHYSKCLRSTIVRLMKYILSLYSE